MADRSNLSIKDATTSLAATLGRIDGHINALGALRDRLLGAQPTTAAIPTPIPPPGGSILDAITSLEVMVGNRLNALESLLNELDQRI